MKLPSAVKTAGFVAACLIWLLVGLTVLGPKVGEQFMVSLDNGPEQPMDSLSCPTRLGPGQTAEIAARYENRSGKTQNYEIHIETQVTGASSGMSTACQPADPVPVGEVGEARCTVGPIDQITRVRLTAWAEGESYLHTCELGCPNSYRSTCVIMPDIWNMLGQFDSLLILGLILVSGLLLVFFGARLWRSAGSSGRIVMIGFFAASALILAVVEYQTFVHWLPAAILLAAMGVACLVAWLRGREAQSA
jgi:hypothetical protein